jgi:hypothetical protein
MNWQAVAAARLAFIMGECLPNVDAEKSSIGPFEGGRSDALPRHSLEKQAQQHHQRGVCGHSAAIRGTLPNWHSRRRAV